MRSTGPAKTTCRNCDAPRSAIWSRRGLCLGCHALLHPEISKTQARSVGFPLSALEGVDWIPRPRSVRAYSLSSLFAYCWENKLACQREISRRIEPRRRTAGTWLLAFAREMGGAPWDLRAAVETVSLGDRALVGRRER
jgi:hypothetical protein